MHIIIAPNAFKHSLDAASAAKAIEQGLRAADPSCTNECIPVGDGGDGTGSLLTNALNGDSVTATVQDPLGRPVTASYGITKGQTAIIEMAAASGIRLLKPEEYDPMRATSFGTGQLIADALNKGAKKIVLCVGGSATVDGGCGLLQALGVRFLDEQNELTNATPENFPRLARIDLSNIHPAIRNCELAVLCDVSNPLLGTNGAARIFGPQKGATEKEVELLENGLQHFSERIEQATGRNIAGMPRGGAAGGVVAGLCGLLNGKAVNGIGYFLDEISFDQSLKNATHVLTGEGSIDLQTLDGKAPYGVALRAKERNIPVTAFAGQVPDNAKHNLSTVFEQVIVITEKDTTLEQGLANTGKNLEQKAFEWMKRLRNTAR